MKKTIQSIFRIPVLEKLLVFLLGNFSSRYLSALATPNYEYPSGTFRKCNRYGINYHLDISDYQNWVLYFNSKADSSFGVLPYVQKGNIILDVGGNIGQTAMMMALGAGESGHVYSFEPFPHTCSLFQNNLLLNPFLQKRVSIIKTAFGAEPGTLKMYADCETNSGANRILPENMNADKTETVPVTTIDLFVQEKALPQLDFIKIDVEGFEMEVLKGAGNTLKKFKPRLFIEVDDNNLKNQGSGATQLSEFILSFGYTIYREGTQELFSAAAYKGPLNIFCVCKQDA